MNKSHTITYFLAVVVSLAWIIPMSGQTARLLRFEPSVIEIDTVRFDQGAFNVRFEYINISDKEVSIIDVHSLCGCAKPVFSRESVRPGEKGHIDVSFDPSTLFAEQKRHLTVISTNGEYRKFNTITIHGYVLRDVTEEEVRYPCELAPGLRSEVAVVGMRLNKKGEISEKIFTIYNNTDKAMALRWEADSRNVSASVPESIDARSSAKIIVRIDTAPMGKGEYRKNLYIFADERKCAVILKGAVE